MRHDVFISYASLDGATAVAICHGLESAGLRCWIAPRDVPPGSEHADSIVQAIESAKAMVLVYSKNADESDQVKREVERAISEKTPLIPVRIEDAAVSPAFEYYMGSIHWLDAIAPPIEDHIDTLVGTLRTLFRDGEHQGLTPPPPPPPPPIPSDPGEYPREFRGMGASGRTFRAAGPPGPPVVPPPPGPPPTAPGSPGAGTPAPTTPAPLTPAPSTPGGLLRRMLSGIFRRKSGSPAGRSEGSAAGRGTAAGPSRAPGPVRPAPPASPEPVSLGVSAPGSVRPGTDFTARFVAHTEALRDEVERTLESLSPTAVHSLGVKRAQWNVGARITVTLEAQGLRVEDPEQHFSWSGAMEILEWDVEVPRDAEVGTDVTLRYDVFVEGIRVAGLKLRTDLAIAGSPSRPQAKTAVTPASSAFVSFSSDDELRVSDRVAALRIATTMDVFYSRDSMRSGPWQPQLEREIAERDLFLLFWSKSASDSDYVEWEWKRALELKGVEAFQLHPLQPIELAPPPPELALLQAEDPLMVIRRHDEMKGESGA